jgi:hypothetical protein
MPVFNGSKDRDWGILYQTGRLTKTFPSFRYCLCRESGWQPSKRQRPGIVIPERYS